jgi:membrane protein implicated in regulation of membrane protease activity
MTWPAFFLGCFVFGFVMSVVSFALSSMHLHFHVHVPFAHQFHVASPHGGHGGQALGAINFATVMVFLAWFGGSGFLLTTQFRWLTVPALILATAVGFAGAGIVFFVMARVLTSPFENMQSVDYHMIGALGRITQPIRVGGTGELVYSQGGTRRSCGARSADGAAIEKGAEVVVTAFERGIAYVRRWEDLAVEKS